MHLGALLIHPKYEHGKIYMLQYHYVRTNCALHEHHLWSVYPNMTQSFCSSKQWLQDSNQYALSSMEPTTWQYTVVPLVAPHQHTLIKEKLYICHSSSKDKMTNSRALRNYPRPKKIVRRQVKRQLLQ